MESFKFFVHPVAKHYKYAGQHCVLGQHNTEIESVNRAGNPQFVQYSLRSFLHALGRLLDLFIKTIRSTYRNHSRGLVRVMKAEERECLGVSTHYMWQMGRIIKFLIGQARPLYQTSSERICVS